jgi:hypothetical protein
MHTPVRKPTMAWLWHAHAGVEANHAGVEATHDRDMTEARQRRSQSPVQATYEHPRLRSGDEMTNERQRETSCVQCVRNHVVGRRRR